MINLKNRKSYTLMEVMVVLLILTVLASLAVPRYNMAIERSRLNEAINILTVLLAAQHRFAMEDPDGDGPGDYRAGSGSGNCLAAGNVDVDITNPTDNYDIILIGTGTTGAPPNELVARVRRWSTLTVCPGTGTEYYRLEIDEEGDITCTNVTGTWCSKFGY